MTILITGGAGYIGSHTLLELIIAGYDCVVLDNLCNATRESVNRVGTITGKEITFIQGDVRDADLLRQLFSSFDISAVFHFAALKAVADSVADPMKYYENNVYGSLVLLQEMAKADVFKLIFSSSATVYGDTANAPVSEDTPIGRPVNPYGNSKLMVEDILRDLSLSDRRWNTAILRYFNPVGAHQSGLIGEDPKGIPSNLLPFIAQVAVGKRKQLHIYGGDYPTHDGSGIRDYIHVVDLALGHVSALKYLNNTDGGVYTWNLGTGIGYSVLEIVKTFERVNGVNIPYTVVGRRPGDNAISFSDSSKAKVELGWVARYDLADMMQDAWRWQKNNPSGYK